MDEDVEAKVMEAEIVERHDSMIHVVSEQASLAHHRSLLALTEIDQRTDANIIIRMVDLYSRLLQYPSAK